MATTAPLPYEFDGARRGSRLEECSDEMLARLVGDADEAAFAVLYERHYQALYRYGRSIVRDDLDAQDALQSAWTSALVALRHGRRDAPVRPWLYRIVHNEAISALRRRRPEATQAIAQGNPAVTSIHGAPSAEETALARERFAVLMADLGRLPERPRGALLMRELSGLTHEEIATALQTSVAAAKQCVYEARRDLADLAAGRATPCDEICRSISGGDRRVLRGRRVKAHLSDCPSCASFASAIDTRRESLHAMSPWLSVPAAITLLDRVLRSGSATGAGAGAGAGAAGGSAGVVASGSTGAVAGSAGTVGSVAAGQVVVAGGVVTKALGTSLLAKAVVAAAAVGAGLVSLGGHGAVPRLVSPPAPLSHAPVAAPVVSAGRIAPPTVARASGTPRPHRAVVGHHRPGAARRALGNRASHPLAPGQARKSSGALPPGQAKRGRAVSPRAGVKTSSRSLAPGQTNRVSAGRAPGQAKKAPGSVVPGQAKNAVPPGHANNTSGSLAPAQATKVGNPSPSSTATHPTGPPATTAPAVAHPAATPPASTPVASTGAPPGKSAEAHSK